MFATYSLNIRRLLTLSIRCRPNLHVKNEHRRIIAEYSLAVRENCSWHCIFFCKGTFHRENGPFDEELIFFQRWQGIVTLVFCVSLK